MSHTSLHTTNEDDLVTGTGDSERIEGQFGDDTLFGAGGDDTLVGGGDNDQLHGGDGDDTVVGGSGDDWLLGEAGNDLLDGGYDDPASGYAGRDTLEGGEGADTLWGHSGDDDLYGGPGNDLLYGQSGDDRLDGGDGDDSFVGEHGEDTLLGGEGVDLVDYDFRGFVEGVYFDGEGSEGLDGGGDPSPLVRLVVDDWYFVDRLEGIEQLRVHGSDFGDTLLGGATEDRLLGLMGDDELVGGAGADTLHAGDGDDWLSGGDDDDELYGDDGVDYVFGGAGDDMLDGGAGDDVLEGGAGDDTLIGSAGIDVAVYDFFAFEAGVAIDASAVGVGTIATIGDGEGGTDSLQAIESLSLRGSFFADTLIAGGGDDTVSGLFGDDRLWGGPGVDTASFVGALTDYRLVYDNVNDRMTVRDLRFDGHGTDEIVGFEYLQFDDAVYSVAELVATMPLVLGGTAGDDRLVAGPYDDTVLGLAGNDTILAEGGADLVDAGDGDDLVETGSGNDTVEAGPGDDTLTGGPADDRLLGGDGRDVAVFAGERAGYAVTGVTNDVNTEYTVEDLNPLDGDEGTDYLLSVEVLRFADGEFVLSREGVVIDGYVGGAQLYLDLNADGVPDAGESTGVSTDAGGRFSLRTALYAPLLAVGGTNADTGLENSLVLSAPVNAIVVSPLTTVVQHLIASGGGSVANAVAAVNAALGIAAGTDLTTYDPVAGGDVAVQRVAAQVAVLATLAAAEEPFTALAAAVATAPAAALDLADAAVLHGILVSAPVPTVSRIASINGALAHATTLQALSQVQGAGLNPANDPPVLVAALADHRVPQWPMAPHRVDYVFREVDDGDALRYSATLADGSPLPAWLSFDSATATFASGSTPPVDGVYELRVAATDLAGASASVGFGLDVDVFADLVQGSDGPDLLHVSGSGRAVIDGMGGDDTLEGGAGDDTLSGGGGGDLLRGGGGADWLDGGDNVDGLSFDLALYGDATGPIEVFLDTAAGPGTASGAGTGIDALVDIEGAYGSPFADRLIGNDESNLFRGEAGSDTIDGAGAPGTLDFVDYATSPAGVSVNLGAGIASDGFGGTDTLLSIEAVIGSSHADTLRGTDGPDLLRGGDGLDQLRGDGGDDTIDGGENFRWFEVDIVDYRHVGGGVTVDLGTGVALADGTDTLRGIEGVLAGGGDDVLIGANAPMEYFRGGAGDDTIDGGPGLDIVDYLSAPAAVTVDLGAGSASGGHGNDSLSGIEVVRASNFADLLLGDGGDNTFRGYRGDDTILGGTGNDTTDYVNATGPVTVDLALGVASGADGSDVLDSIEGIVGSNFDDTLLGDDGANTIRGARGDDLIDGRGGRDAAYYGIASGPVTVDLAAGVASGADGNDTLTAIEDVIGSLYDDALRGDDGPNRLRGDESEFGGAGDDSLEGAGGDDTLEGGGGDDALDGGAGDDMLIGEDGIDAAYYAGGRSDYRVTLEGGVRTVAAIAGQDGSDTLDGVEWLQFADRKVSIDFGPEGHAEITAKILGAVFAPAAVGNAQYAGIGLDLLQGGLDYADLMQVALQARLGVGFATPMMVELLLGNLGLPTDAQTVDYFSGFVGTPDFPDDVALAVFAADHEYNTTRIDLAGLQQDGLEFL